MKIFESTEGSKLATDQWLNRHLRGLRVMIPRIGWWRKRKEWSDAILRAFMTPRSGAEELEHAVRVARYAIHLTHATRRRHEGARRREKVRRQVRAALRARSR